MKISLEMPLPMGLDGYIFTIFMWWNKLILQCNNGEYTFATDVEQLIGNSTGQFISLCLCNVNSY